MPLRPDFEPSARSAVRSRTRRSSSPPSPAPPRRPRRREPRGVRILALEDPRSFPRATGRRAAFGGARASRGRRCPHRARLPGRRRRKRCACRRRRGLRHLGRDDRGRPEVMFAPVRDRFRGGAGRTAADYGAALRALDRPAPPGPPRPPASTRWLLPTTANLPPEVDVVSRRPAFSPPRTCSRCATPTSRNLLGLCAITLPTGMPYCGLMLMAPGGDEARLLRLAAARRRRRSR